jgi:hypothetical protein
VCFSWEYVVLAMFSIHHCSISNKCWRKTGVANLSLLESIGVGLIFAGVLMIIVAVFLLAILNLKKGNIQGGAQS